MRRLLPIFAVGFIIASLLIYVFGDSGLFEYRRLDSYRRSLEANVEKLQERNAGLTKDLGGLRDDPERSLVMAREIGLYQAGDEVIRLEGGTRGAVSYEVGDLIRLRRSHAARNTIFKVTGLGISCLLVALAFLGAQAARRKTNGGSRVRS